MVDLRRPSHDSSNPHVALPIEVDVLEQNPAYVGHAMGNARPDQVVRRLIALEHMPHRFHVIARELLVPMGVQVADQPEAPP